MEGVDAGIEADMEEEMMAGRQKEDERGKGYRSGCYIQDDGN